MGLRLWGFLILSVCICGTVALAKEDSQSARSLEWGGYIDGLYAYDFNEPTSGDRSFTLSQLVIMNLISIWDSLRPV